MDDRFRELWRRAVLNNTSTSTNFDAAAGEFSQMIVKECANVCESHAWGLYEHGMPGQEDTEYCAKLILDILGDE